MEAKWPSAQLHRSANGPGIMFYFLTVYPLSSKARVHGCNVTVMYSLGIRYQSQDPRGHRHGCRKTEVAVRGN